MDDTKPSPEPERREPRGPIMYIFTPDELKKLDDLRTRAEKPENWWSAEMQNTVAPPGGLLDRDNPAVAILSGAEVQFASNSDAAIVILVVYTISENIGKDGIPASQWLRHASMSLVRRPMAPLDEYEKPSPQFCAMVCRILGFSLTEESGISVETHPEVRGCIRFLEPFALPSKTPPSEAN